jgi:hypothetical protein
MSGIVVKVLPSGAGWKVMLFKGAQSFQILTGSDDRKNCLWFARQLRKALK